MVDCWVMFCVVVCVICFPTFPKNIKLKLFNRFWCMLSYTNAAAVALSVFIAVDGCGRPSVSRILLISKAFAAL